MLDALKVLFILTGASTYLVTKYVKVGLGTKNNETTTVIGGLPSATISPEMREYWEKASSVLRKHYGSVVINGKSNVENTINGRKPAIVNTAVTAGNNNLNDDNIQQQSNATSSSSTLSATKQELLEESVDSVVEYVKPTYVIKLVEEDNKLLPKLLLQVAANTKPTEKRTKIIYFLSDTSGSDDSSSTSSNEISTKFIVNSTTGELFLLSALDRDLPNGKPEWEMTILAKYDTSEDAFGFADIIIHLTDINDNNPVFERQVFIANISESTPLEPSVALKVNAVDFDDNETENGRVVYSMPDSNSVFAIDSKTGIISFNCCVDRETESQYIFEVLATDGGGLSSKATVIINIIDTNDSPPRFLKPNHTIDLVAVDERHLEEPILVLSVRDRDLLENNYFYCQLFDTEFLKEFLVMTNLDGSCSLFITQYLINHLNPSDTSGNNGTNSSVINLQRVFSIGVCVSDNGPKNTVNLAANSSHSDCAHVTVSLTSDAFINQTYMRRRFDDNPCSTVTCKNGGTCLSSDRAGDTKHGFKCQCVQGFSGLFCDTSQSMGDTVIIRFGNPAVIVILICLINVLILLLIIVIYTQTRSRVRPKTYIKNSGSSSSSSNNNDAQPNNSNAMMDSNDFSSSYSNKKLKTELSPRSVDTRKKFASHQSKLLSTKTSNDGRVAVADEGSHESLFDTTTAIVTQQQRQYFYYESDPYMTECYNSGAPNITAVAPDVIVTIHQTPSMTLNNSFDISDGGDMLPCVVYGGSGGGEDYQSSLSSSNAPTVTGVCCYGNNCEKDKCMALAQQLKKSSQSLNSIGTQLHGKMTTV